MRYPEGMKIHVQYLLSGCCVISLSVAAFARFEVPAGPALGAADEAAMEQVVAGESQVVAGRNTLSRPGNGEPVCGLGASFHAGRRALLRERIGQGVLVFRGLPEPRGYQPFEQDKSFWYLTGVEGPDAALVMDAESGREVLLLPKPNARFEAWDGELWDSADEWVGPLTGFLEVRPSTELEAVIEELLGEDEGRSLWTSLYPNVTGMDASDRVRAFDRRQERDELDGRVSRERALAQHLEQRFERTVQDCSKELTAMRFVKTTEEIEALRRAGLSGALAMLEGIRSTRAGLGEWEIASLMSFVQVREGARGPAYYPIVGSGPNSCVLHYSAVSRSMRNGELLLVDFGGEVDQYTTDITRTWPVNGKFSDEQAEFYDAVLAAQLAAIAAVKPGLRLSTVANAANKVLIASGYGEFIRHGVSHYIGLEVHDPSPDLALEVGAVFTIEPGLYDPERNIGVRIEDVVVVTEGGCEVLTAGVPKSRADMERLVGEEGILDRLAAREGQ